MYVHDSAISAFSSRGVSQLTQFPAGGTRGQSVSKRHKVMEPRNEVEARYLAYMAAEGMSPETVRQRIYLLRGLSKAPRDVSPDDIVALINGRQLSVHSRAAYVTVLKTVFADMCRIGLADRDPTLTLKTPRAPRRSPRPLTLGELDALEQLQFSHPREYAFTILGAYAGLRAGEVCSLPGTALQDGQHGAVLRVHGKGGVDAVIAAHPKVQAVLAPYMGQEDAIWPMWPSSLDRAWKAAAASVGVTGRTFHQLRHTFATRLTRAGVDLLVIANLCRHSSVATTQRYAAVADDAPFQAIVGL